MPEKILYPFRDLSLGLYSASDETRMPPNALQTATNVVYDHNVWKRKKGRAKYNKTEMGVNTAPKGFWKLDDNLANTTVIDSSGNGHTGTCSVNTSVASATGKIDKCFDFNGDRYVTVPHSDDFSFGDGSNDSAFSISTWIYVTDTVSWQLVVSKYDETTDSEKREWYLSLMPNETIRLWLYDESADVDCCRDTNAGLEVGWRLVTVTYDGTGGATAATGITIYVDGSSVASTATNDDNYVAMENLTANILLGSQIYTSGNPVRCFQDKIDHIRIFNVELSSSEVSAMYDFEEVRGLFRFATGSGAESMLAVCNGSFYKTTGDGSMGSALTEPDATAVSITNTFDVFGALYRNRLYLTWGDVSDHPVFYDGTNIINYEKEATGTADSGTTTTLVDGALNQAEDYWNGARIKITDSTDGTVYWGWVTNFVAADDTVTFSPTCSFDVDDTDAYELGVAAQEERNGKYTLIFKERMFTAVGSTIYFTDPYNPDKWTPDSGVNIKYPGRDDGEDISGMVGLDNYLVVFKPHHIYAYFVVGDKDYWNCIEVKGTDSNKGCVWHRTIDAGFGGIIYMSWDGVYVLDRSLNVRCVSRNIDPTIKALAQSVSNPGGMSSVTKTDTSKVDFDAGKTQTKIDTATVSGTFRVTKTDETSDQTITGSVEMGYTIRYHIAQSFKPSIDCILTKVQLNMYRVGTPPNDFIVYLKSDDNNSMGDTLASKTIVAGSIGTSSAYVDVDFPDTNLTANTRYWIYIPAQANYSINNEIFWNVYTTGTYDNGRFYWKGEYDDDKDARLITYEQHYEQSPEFISQIHDLTAPPTAWRPFIATKTLNGCSIAWYFRADSSSTMANDPEWHAVENGGIPDETLAQYTQYRAVPDPTNVATPVVDDVTIQAYLGTSVITPCAKVYKKAYWLSVQDTSSSVNSCVYWLDEEAVMYENKERWAKLDNIYVNYFTIFNDQLISGSVGGTGLGGFLYYENVGTKDLGNNFTSTLITKKDDFQSANPSYVNRRKVYQKFDVKYKSNVASSLYYKIDNGDWSSALSLSPKADTGVERVHFQGLCTGRYITCKHESTSADNELQIHGWDILTLIKPFY